MCADAGSLHCPNCGAAVRGDGGRCPYCHARLATVSCPACFALMFAGARYCHACGALRTRTEAEERAPVACPGCRREMRRLTVGAAAMLECEGCDGIWIDADVFERICADREAQTAVLHRFAAAAPSQAMPIRVEYRPCPRCFNMMNRVNFSRISGAVVDVCKGHGTFLDAGELHQIVTFIAQGGLERARARQIEDLREQERSLADAERRASTHYDRDSRFDAEADDALEAFGIRRVGFGALFDLIRGKYK